VEKFSFPAWMSSLQTHDVCTNFSTSTFQRVRNKLIAEEPRVEQLKSRLKELFRFPQDSKNLSDEVLAVVKEYQRWAATTHAHPKSLQQRRNEAWRNTLMDILLIISYWWWVVNILSCRRNGRLVTFPLCYCQLGCQSHRSSQP